MFAVNKSSCSAEQYWINIITDTCKLKATRNRDGEYHNWLRSNGLIAIRDVLAKGLTIYQLTIFRDKNVLLRELCESAS